MRITTIALICASVFATSAIAAEQAAPPPPTGVLLTSSAYPDDGVIPDKYTQASANPVSPPLSWTNAPAGTVTYTLILHDLEGAPAKGSEDVLHWMVFNIPATKTSLPEGVSDTAQMPDGSIQIKNRAGKVGFLGPGSRVYYHHYTFEIYALDTKLELHPDATRADVMKAMDGHVLAKGAYVGRFHR